jgi:hypothetical protein
MPRLDKIGNTATTVSQGPDGLRVTYHSTDVVTVSKTGKITLNTGGWFTNTTKTRMNQAAHVFGLGYRVYQNKHKWFVRLAPWNETPTHPDLAFNGNLISFKVVKP